MFLLEQGQDPPVDFKVWHTTAREGDSLGGDGTRRILKERHRVSVDPWDLMSEESSMLCPCGIEPRLLDLIIFMPMLAMVPHCVWFGVDCKGRCSRSSPHHIDGSRAHCDHC